MRFPHQLNIAHTAAPLAVLLTTSCAHDVVRASTPTTLQVVGRVDAPGDMPEGIYLYTVQPDGTTEPIAMTPVLADADGRFAATLQITAPTGILALSDGTYGRYTAVALTEESRAGQLVLPVLDTESTVEAEVYLTARRRDWWTDDARLHRLRGLVTPALADAILGADDYRGGLDLTARTALAAMEAWRTALRNLGYDGAILDDLDEALATARAAADLEQVDAHTDDQETLATQRFELAQARAYHAARLDDAALAAASMAAAEATRTTVANRDTNVAAELIWTGEVLRAKYVGAWLMNEIDAIDDDAADRHALHRAVVDLRAAVQYGQGQPSRAQLRGLYAPLLRQVEKVGRRAFVGSRFETLYLIALIPEIDIVELDLSGGRMNHVLGNHTA